jgi:hypothetical protein
VQSNIIVGVTCLLLALQPPSGRAAVADFPLHTASPRDRRLARPARCLVG